jgi:hypothetical protein
VRQLRSLRVSNQTSAATAGWALVHSAASAIQAALADGSLADSTEDVSAIMIGLRPA